MENIYEKTLNLCNFPLRVTDFDGKILIVNDEYCNFLGVKKEDIIGKSFETLYSPENRKEALNYYRNFIKKGLSHQKSERILTLSNGKRLVIELSYNLVVTEEGKFILAFFNDLTEKRKTEELLKESEETFRKLFEESFDSILLLTTEGFQDCNNATLRIFGYKNKTDIIGKQPWEVSPDIQPDGLSSENKAKMMIKKALKDGYNFFEWIHKKSDGTNFPCEVLLFKINIKNKQYFYSVVRDISKRKKIEAELIKSEERYKTIFENTGSLTIIVEEDNTIVLANNEAYSVTGYKPEEIIGTKWTDYVSEESIEMMLNYHKMRRISPEKVPSRYEAVLFNKKGERRNCVLNVKMIPNTKESVISIYDITEIIKAKESLRESEEKFRRLVDNTEDIIYRYEFYPKPGFRFVSSAATKITGYTPEEHYSDPELGIKIVHPDDRHILQNYFQNKDEFNKPIVLRWIRKDGKIIYTEQKNVPIYDKNGKLIALEGIARDITERKRTEEELEKSEAKYRNLVENSLTGIYTTDIDGNILYANKAFCEIFELDSIEDAYKVNVKSFYENEDERIKLINEIRKNGKILNYELSVITKKGRKIFVLLNSFMLGDVITGMIMDISDIKRYEQEIISAREKAEEMSRIKSSFLANMSHELRTPLQGILGFAELIQEQNNLKSVKDMAEVIYKSGIRLLNTLNQILDLSLLEAKSKTVNYKNVDIVSLINETIKLFQPEARKKNLLLLYDSELKSLPCLTDPDIIVNILNNLISNGITYTEKGKVTVKLTEEVIESGVFIKIEVIDTGIGIEEKYFDIIFNEFRQVSEGYGRSFEGTGLGLTLCRKYLNLLGGDINVESKLGVGSNFIVRIPKIRSKVKEINSEKKLEIPFDRYRIDVPKLKILLVEDEDDCILLVDYYLRPNYEIDVAKNAEEAFEKIKKNLYSLVLMDINLGKGLSGMDVVTEIRKIPEYKDIPIIALTAFAMKGDMEEFISGGCDSYISKPFTKEG